MIINKKLLLLLITINWFPFVILVSIRELVKIDAFVDNNKGYALRRLGIYSPNVVEQIIHSFIPLNDLCATEPNTNICSYSSQLRKSKIFELSTKLSSRDVAQTFSYDKDNVAKSIGNDVIQVFSQHHPDEFLNKQMGMVHFTNNQFYYKNRDDQPIQSTSENNSIDNYSDIPRVSLIAAQQIIQRVNNQKIDFDYLSSDDVETFLSAISSNFDSLYGSSNVQDAINLFSELIIGQSIYGLPYCSLARENSHSSQPCLVISTLFIRAPVNSVSTFSVYRLIPLPVIFDHKKYIYSNLPQIIGINPVDNTIVIWEEKSNINKCTFSTMVLCQQKPISVSISKSSCLGQLLDEQQLSTSLCDVNHSDNIQQDALHVSDGLWLFYNVHQTINCQVYTSANALPELISIKEAALVPIPCEKTITCADFQLPVTSCKRNDVIRTPSFGFTAQNSSESMVSIRNMTNTILAAYRSQFNKTVDELKTVFKTNQSTIYQTLVDLAGYIISSILLTMMLVCFRCNSLKKQKLQRQMDTVGSRLQHVARFHDAVIDLMLDEQA